MENPEKNPVDKPAPAGSKHTVADTLVLLRKACELRVLGQIWEEDRQTAIAARFVRLRLSPWPCLILSPEVPQGAKLFGRGSNQHLSFRINSSQYSCSTRVLLRLATTIVCSVPKEIRFHHMRKQPRQPQHAARDVVCDFGSDLPRFYPGLGATRDAKQFPIEVVDISTGGLRVKVQQTKHALALDIGEIFRHVTLALARRSEAETVACHLELANIVVREEWTRAEDDITPVRTRTSYLGFIYVNLTAETAEEIQRLVHAVAMTALEQPPPSAGPTAQT